MKFKSLKSIESSFRQIRLFDIVFLSLCAVVTVWSIWSSCRFAEKQRGKIYVLDNGKSPILALSQDLSQNRPARAQEHVRRFHELFFTLSPEKDAIEHNVKHTLLLADRSVYHYYSNFTEKGHHNRIIVGNINQVLKVDSTVCDLNAYPYHAMTYATQKVVRQSDVAERSPVTTCHLLNASRSDDNPNGFTIEGFTIIENKDLQTIERQRTMKRKVESIRRTMQSAYWKLHDKRKRLVTGLKRYLGGLSPETRRCVMLRMLAAFAVLALCTFGRIVYDIGRNGSLRMRTGHTGRVELPTPVETGDHLTSYSYGTDEE